MSSLESKRVYANFMTGYHVISRSDKYLAGLVLFLRQNIHLWDLWKQMGGWQRVAVCQNNDGDIDIDNACDSAIYSLPYVVSLILNTRPVSNTNL